MDDKDKDTNERSATEDVVESIPALVENRTQDDKQHAWVDSNNEGSSKVLPQPQFRLYKRRFLGLFGIVALNIVAGMNGTWFGPITNKTSETFDISTAEVNWLGNIIPCTNIAFSPLVPFVCSFLGLRHSFTLGSVFLLISAWVRFSGTADPLSSRRAYGSLISGQFLSAIPQILFQVLAPKFSEVWFDQNGRTTATMIMSVANPVGAALGQLLSPMFDDVRDSILLLGILSTVITVFTILISDHPPTPPSYSGSHPSPRFITTLRAIFGLLSPPPPEAADIPGGEKNSDGARTKTSGNGLTKMPKDIPVLVDAYMTLRERVDFVILTLVFSVLVSGVNTFSLLSNEILDPYGYSESTAGLMGAALLLSGIVAAFVTSPIFDRVLTHHLGLSARIAVPIIAACWVSLIWAVRPNNTGALYAIFVIIGVFSVSMLPVALELGCELTRNSDASSALLWWSANIATIVFTLVMPALRASADAPPPLNMRRSLIYLASCICGGAVFILVFRGEQRRRAKDARIAAEADESRVVDSPDVERAESGATGRNPFRFLGKKEETKG